MRPARWLTLTLALCLGASLAGMGWAQARTLVVFEIDMPGAAPLGRALTDALRALARARAPQTLHVLDQTEVEALLPPAPGGGRLSLAECEGDCALQTGRTLGVDLMLTGRVRSVKDRWTATVALVRTDDGKLLGQHVAEGGAPKATLIAAADRVLKVWLDSTPRGVRTAERLYTTGPPRLHLSSTVPTRITIDGVAMGTTPLAVPVHARYARIDAQADGYAPQRLTVDVGPMSARLALTMVENTGLVMLQWPEDYPDVSLWLDGEFRRQTKSIRLPPGVHHVQMRSPCGDSPRTSVMVEKAGRHRVELTPVPRCPRLKLRSKQPMKVRLAGKIYDAPGTTDRITPGRTRIQLMGRVTPSHTVHVPAQTDDVAVTLPDTPADVGGDLGWQYRENAGGMAYLRVWNHARQAMRPRWGMHLGLGVMLDDARTETQDRSFGGVFLGPRVGIPLTSWLEWTVGAELALVATDGGVPLFAGADTALRFRLPHFAVGVGWGVAAHGQVDGWSDAHGLRLSVALTE